MADPTAWTIFSLRAHCNAAQVEMSRDVDMSFCTRVIPERGPKIALRSLSKQKEVEMKAG